MYRKTEFALVGLTSLNLFMCLFLFPRVQLQTLFFQTYHEENRCCLFSTAQLLSLQMGLWAGVVSCTAGIGWFCWNLLNEVSWLCWQRGNSCSPLAPFDPQASVSSLQDRNEQVSPSSTHTELYSFRFPGSFVYCSFSSWNRNKHTGVATSLVW